VPVSLPSQVSCKGAAFEGYSAAIVSNSFGGDVIDMLDMDDLTQFMETMGIATNHKLLLKATFAGWKKNPDLAFEALATAKVAPAMVRVRAAFRHFNAGRCREESGGGCGCRPEGVSLVVIGIFFTLRFRYHIPPLPPSLTPPPPSHNYHHHHCNLAPPPPFSITTSFHPPLLLHL
jgi:hypothetical protein